VVYEKRIFDHKSIAANDIGNAFALAGQTFAAPR